MLDQEGANRFFQQIFELWVNPELQKRSDAGSITLPYNLEAAEVVMHGDGRPNIVRLNSEIRSKLYLKIPTEKASQYKIGDNISLEESEGLHIQPPEDEANEGHVVLIRIGDTWAFTFNFTYNNAHIAECFKAANQFIATAEECLKNHRLRVFVDNLFSAVELMSKCILLMMPGKTKHSHQYIQTRINERKKHNSIGGDIAPLLNRLSSERDKARYTTLPYTPDESMLEAMLAEAKICFQLCESQIPRRTRELLQNSSKAP